MKNKAGNNHNKVAAADNLKNNKTSCKRHA